MSRKSGNNNKCYLYKESCAFTISLDDISCEVLGTNSQDAIPLIVGRPLPCHSSTSENLKHAFLGLIARFQSLLDHKPPV